MLEKGDIHFFFFSFFGEKRHTLDVDMNQIYVRAKTASYCIKFTSSACAILNHNIWRNKFLWPENHFIPINLLIQIDQMDKGKRII